MNYVIDDYGRTVIAIGAPGSIERVKVERPKLIDHLNSLYFQSCDSPGRAVDEAVELIRENGITSKMETASILKASKYGEEQAGSVTCIVCSIANAPADQTAVAGMVRRDVGQCEDCNGTGWYGDNGPGIIGNAESVRCDCGTGEKCRCGYHPYIEVGGNIPWCEKCNREADMDICRIHHFLPNAANEPRSASK